MQLQPIGESNSNTSLAHANGAPRVEYVSSPSSAPRYTQEGYVRAPQRVNSLESNQPSRFAPPVPTRRPSEQDLVIPSIEREAEPIASPRHVTAPQHHRKDSSPFHVGYSDASRVDAQAPKRKELHPSIQNGEERRYKEAPQRLRPAYTGDETLSMSRPPPLAMSPHIHRYEDVQSRLRMQPPQYEMVDLTLSSPVRPLHSTSRNGHVVPVHSYTTARSDNHLYAPVPSHKSYYEVPRMDSSRFEQSIHPRMNERHYPPHEYVAVRNEPLHPQIEVGGRATRNRLVHGGYKVH
jgi:hypothetical protein